MPTEAELRELLHGDDGEPGALNATRIIRQAKARRRPKQLAAALAGGVAAVGAIAFTVPALLGSSLGLSTASGGSAADEGMAGDDASTLKQYDGPESAGSLAATAQMLNLCGSTVVEIALDPAGPVLTVAPVDAAAASDEIDATVTLINSGGTAITTASPLYLSFADDSSVLWQGEGATVTVTELEPGESAQFTATFEPVRCAPGDGTTDDSTASLPAGPGEYRLSAAIDVVTPDGAARVVTGPATGITLH